VAKKSSNKTTANKKTTKAPQSKAAAAPASAKGGKAKPVAAKVSAPVSRKSSVPTTPEKIVKKTTKSAAAPPAPVPVIKSKKSRLGRVPAAPVYHAPPPVVATTDGKPLKNQAGIGARDLEHYRDLLLAKRRELVGDMTSMESEALRSSGGSNLSNLPLHMADMGTDRHGHRQLRTGIHARADGKRPRAAA
jgi:DnaK suppressor protein